MADQPISPPTGVAAPPVSGADDRPPSDPRTGTRQSRGPTSRRLAAVFGATELRPSAGSGSSSLPARLNCHFTISGNPPDATPPPRRHRRVAATAITTSIGTPTPQPPRLAPPGAHVRLAAAASWYLVPVIQAALSALSHSGGNAAAPVSTIAATRPPGDIWASRATMAQGDYEAWRESQLSCTPSNPWDDLPEWRTLVGRAATTISRRPAEEWAQIDPTCYISGSLQERLLGLDMNGLLPTPLIPLQRWAGARLAFCTDSEGGDSDHGESAAGPTCPYCDVQIGRSAPSTIVRCSGPCGTHWHRGCVAGSVRGMTPAHAARFDPTRAGWACCECLETPTWVSSRSRQPVRPPIGAEESEVRRGTRDGHARVISSARRDSEVAAPATGPDLSEEPGRVVLRPTAPVPVGTARLLSMAPSTDLAAFDVTLRRLTVDEAWDWIAACRESAPGPPRRFLPAGAPSARAPPASRRLAVAVTALVAKAALDGVPAAQAISLYLPRLFMRRNVEIRTQVTEFIEQRQPSPMARQEPELLRQPDLQAAERLRRWCHRVDVSQDSGDVRALARILHDGPADATWPEATRDEWLSRLFPRQPDGEADDEGAEWLAMAAPLLEAAPAVELSGRDVLKWARARRTKAADTGGWSGQIILDLALTDPHAGVAELLARLWGAPPSFWVDPRTRAAAFRTASGVLLRQHGKEKPRPIAAPCVPRRVASAADARLARPLANAYCVARGQVGLADGGPLAAYSIFPRLVVAMGGTSCSADNTSSFQTFTRRGLIDGISAAIRSQQAAELPAAAAALARLMSRYVFDVHCLPRTTTTFADGKVVTSHALAQGCSASPTAEAIILATAPRAPLPPGALRKSAHDDSQGSIMPGCPIEALAPPAPWGGSVYNTDKSVAVGAQAEEAVRLGHAAKANPYASVFGAPIGDIAAWAREVWLPRWRRQCEAILVVNKESPDVAALAASLIRGPGASASHWLRLAPCDQLTRDVLKEADDEWISLWIRLAGHDPNSLSTPTLQSCADRVFGAGPECLNHLSACDIADARYWGGLAQAWPTLVKWATEMNAAELSIARLATTAGVPRSITHPAEAGAPLGDAHAARIVNAWLRQRAADAELSLLTERWRRRARLDPDADTTPGAKSSPGAVDSGSPNLLVTALRSSAWSPAGRLSADGHGATYIVARVLGLAVWPALGVTAPSHCKRCAAPAPSSVGDADRVEDTDARVAPSTSRGTLDDDGEHIAACTASGPMAGAKWRHDALARDLAHISNGVGRDGRYHDGQLFTFGRKTRPADLLELGRVCIDVTIGSRRVMSVADRELSKSRKYAPQVALHPPLIFRPFAIDHNGEIGPEATRILHDWSRSLAASRRSAGLCPGDPLTDVTVAIARAYVRGMCNQAVAWRGRGRGIVM